MENPVNKQSFAKRLSEALRLNRRKSLPNKPSNLDEKEIKISYNEAEMLTKLKELNRNPRYVYELSNYDGKPSLKVSDNILLAQANIVNVTHFVAATSVSEEKIHGYDRELINILIDQLNALQEMREIIKQIS